MNSKKVNYLKSVIEWNLVYPDFGFLKSFQSYTYWYFFGCIPLLDFLTVTRWPPIPQLHASRK